jgi:DNA replication and repair protein RecF
LADSISGFEQVLVTAAVLGDVPERLAAKVVRISAGLVVPNE